MGQASRPQHQGKRQPSRQPACYGRTIRTNRGTQELEGDGGNHGQAGWEQQHVNARGCARVKHKETLARLELQACVPRLSNEVPHRASNMRSRPGDDHIAEVAKAQVDGVSGSRTKGRLQRECELQKTKRIALLDPSRRHDPVPEAQVRSLAVAVVGPAGDSWQMLTRARKECLAAHRVEPTGG